MITLLFRTVVIYMLLSLSMRLMGKRQIAELELSELVTTLLLSELAVVPIENREVPLFHAILPVAALMFIEIGMSVLLTRCPRLKQRINSTPSILICRGIIDQTELSHNRMSIEELFAGLRQQGITDPGEVEYAILEKNGSISVLPWAEYRPATPKDLDRHVDEVGVMHIVVSNGIVNHYNLRLLHRDTRWVDELCRRYGIELKNIFCLLCNDAGDVTLIPRQRKNSRPPAPLGAKKQR